MATEAELETKLETLAETRDYARSVLHHTYEEVVRGCTQSLSLYGFWCVPSPSTLRHSGRHHRSHQPGLTTFLCTTYPLQRD